MKLRIPFGCGALSHAGRTIEIDANGYVDVMEEVAHVLLGHGFTPISKNEAEVGIVPPAADSEADQIAMLNRPALFAFLKARGVSVSLPVTNDELRRMAEDASKNGL